MTDSVPYLTAPIDDLGLSPKWFSVGSRWIYDSDVRLDATIYSAGAFQALDAIQAAPFIKASLGSLCGKMWHPVQTQARSNFKRIYTDAENGVPFVSSREMFFFPLRPDRFLSKQMPKLNDLMVSCGWLLISRSGTVGNVLFTYTRLSQCAITDHAIRIEPLKVPAGFLYALLASKYGQPLISSRVYGSTVNELEPKHLASIPVPIPEPKVQQSIHEKIIRAYKLRDEANDLVDAAEGLLYRELGIEPFSERDIEYLGLPGDPKAFTISASELGERFDATNHVPYVRSAVDKLRRSTYDLVQLGALCREIYHAPRFARIYVEPPLGRSFIQCSQMPLFRMYDQRSISLSANRTAIENGTVQFDDLLITRSGTIGRVGLISRRLVGSVASDDFIRVRCEPAKSDAGFIFAFLNTPFGQCQLTSEMFGGVVDHINREHAKTVLVPAVPLERQTEIGELVKRAFELRDQANDLEDAAVAEFERLIDRSATS